MSAEGIRSAVLSADGSKLAAVVSHLGEVRLYDLDSDQLTVYTRGEEGEIQGTIGVLVDTTERALAEEALHRLNEKR